MRQGKNQQGLATTPSVPDLPQGHLDLGPGPEIPSEAQNKMKKKKNQTENGTKKKKIGSIIV